MRVSEEELSVRDGAHCDETREGRHVLYNVITYNQTLYKVLEFKTDAIYYTTS